MTLIVERHEPWGYPELVLHAGEIVKIEGRDDEWPLWLWGSHERGAGWIPEAFLDLTDTWGTLKREYTTREVQVEVGDEVQVLELHGGWAFVRKQSGDEGWIVDRCLQQINPLN